MQLHQQDLTAFSPTLTDFTNNPTFKITFDKTCADNATIQIAGITPPLNLKYKTSIGTFINVAAGDILANHTTIGLLINNNTDLLIQPSSASGLGNSSIRNRIINGAMKIDQRNAGVAQAIVAAAANVPNVSVVLA